MDVLIRTRAIEVTEELEQLVSKRLELALDIFKERAESASVYIADLNGPRRGIDKICQITVRLRGIGDVVVLEKSSTVESALTRAAGRMKYRVSETIRRAVRPATESIRRSEASL